MWSKTDKYQETFCLLFQDKYVIRTEFQHTSLFSFSSGPSSSFSSTLFKCISSSLSSFTSSSSPFSSNFFSFFKSSSSCRETRAGWIAHRASRRRPMLSCKEITLFLFFDGYFIFFSSLWQVFLGVIETHLQADEFFFPPENTEVCLLEWFWQNTNNFSQTRDFDKKVMIQWIMVMTERVKCL